MRLKLDENLGRRCIDLFTAAGHDVATVVDQGLSAAQDDELIEVCRKENRAIVTLDLDFSNPLVYLPEKFAGIAVLRLPSKPSYESLAAVARTLVDALNRESLAGHLWSVEPGRVRIYQAPSDNP